MFLVAGAVYSCKDYKSFISKKIHHILVPYVVFDIIERAEAMIPLIDMAAIAKEYGIGHEPKLLPFDKLLKQ